MSCFLLVDVPGNPFFLKGTTFPFRILLSALKVEVDSVILDQVLLRAGLDYSAYSWHSFMIGGLKTVAPIIVIINTIKNQCEVRLWHHLNLSR